MPKSKAKAVSATVFIVRETEGDYKIFTEKPTRVQEESWMGLDLDDYWTGAEGTDELLFMCADGFKKAFGRHLRKNRIYTLFSQVGR